MCEGAEDKIASILDGREQSQIPDHEMSGPVRSVDKFFQYTCIIIFIQYNWWTTKSHLLNYGARDPVAQ